jgi:hypothetical protein
MKSGKDTPIDRKQINNSNKGVRINDQQTCLRQASHALEGE